MSESAIQFQCQGSTLLGVIHHPKSSVGVGVVIVVAGGPQYRVGVSRQFVMLARFLTEQGITVLRFDHRGTGDSEGSCRGFMDMGADIECAVDALLGSSSGIEKTLLWGECESATALAFYAHLDSRVSGLFLVNPWIRTEEGEAKAYLKHYYWSRLFDKSLWEKIFSGQFSPIESCKSFFKMSKKIIATGREEKSTAVSIDQLPLPDRLEKCIGLYEGSVCIVTSGRDFIAKEFTDYAGQSKEWKSYIASGRVSIDVMIEADHTFSRIEWRSELFDRTKSWVNNTILTGSLE